VEIGEILLGGAGRSAVLQDALLVARYVKHSRLLARAAQLLSLH
jgi:hypothetical protein